MKKNSYYFSLLTEVEQGQYKENYERLNSQRGFRTFDEFLNGDQHSFENFVASGFVWLNTPQGFKYWCLISERPEPTDQENQIITVQFIPTLEEIESVLKSDKFKEYSFKDLAYSLSSENILDIILELQKPKP